MIKKTGSPANVNEVLAQEWHKPVIKKFKKRKSYVRFKDHIWASDLAGMGSWSIFNRGVKYVLCEDVFIKHAYVTCSWFYWNSKQI